VKAGATAGAAMAPEALRSAPPPLAALFERQLDPVEMGSRLGDDSADAADLALLSAASLARPVPDAVWEDALLGPARDMLTRPGKGFRAALVDACYRLAGGAGDPPPALAALIEVVHAGSLIVDDVEDDSSRRRGRATLHRLHGVPLAINCGNWMYFWAFELLGELALPAAADTDLRRRLSRTMYRCHFGQALDLSVHVGRVAQSWVPPIVRATGALKTGTLTELAAAAGAVAAGAPPSQIAALARFGRRLGVGLQVLDDLGNLAPAPAGDRGADEKRHEDLRLGRPAWPWAFAAEQLGEMEFAALQAELRVLSAHARAGAPVAAEAEALATRLRAAVGMRGRRAARVYLQRALADLQRETGPGPGLDELRATIAALEDAYGG
jgi:geranylgeranyl pyrophosphate synthase